MWVNIFFTPLTYSNAEAMLKNPTKSESPILNVAKKKFSGSNRSNFYFQKNDHQNKSKSHQIFWLFL